MNQIEPFSTDSSGEYTITVNIESIASIPELRDKLQVCYDEGAAGHFSIQSNEDARQIVFTRSFSDDFEMLEERINKGEPIHAAARNQLADEIENAQFGPDCLTSVIMALRDPTNGVVVGLAERRKLPERESRNDNGHFSESDEMVALRWKQYMDNRVETVIYPAPKKEEIGK